jgi:hypothetical protein
VRVGRAIRSRIVRAMRRTSCYAPRISWSGPSSRARRLTPILPAMPIAEALASTRIHRVAGLTGDRTAEHLSILLTGCVNHVSIHMFLGQLCEESLAQAGQKGMYRATTVREPLSADGHDCSLPLEPPAG